MCIEIGGIDSENELIKTSKPEFVHIRWNPIEETLKSKPYSNDQNNQHCINGFKIKQNVSNFVKYNFEMGNIQLDKTKAILPTSESAALKVKFSSFSDVPTSQSFSDALTDVLNVQQQQEQNSEQLLLYKNNFLIFSQIAKDFEYDEAIGCKNDFEKLCL
ncbi:unnamed protein product [Didymodactylos carnosus]|uniref:Uncharacterized protein n=1 Tax=Didymodactylos carnosus TaxID=1234261 RepID=A0A814YPU1_9BILA|nr:unnamed protein product [Didymodactylos carnosus]CAF1231464.1 unnamed protein product [Didymodactylos carnosus]CAF3814348.1 unnamed protein product [Didymodactylos carnosus]CAF3994171.1 unnamed protein product [Didymodactylos carnosus]